MSPCPCPCHSGRVYSECCEPFHLGKPAPTPETLMRSRYSAFVYENGDYLLMTWHKEYRPQTLEFAPHTRWYGLDVLAASDDGMCGQVHFLARFSEDDEWLELEEKSRFERLDGRWYYLAGETDFRPLATGRNDPCPCGSGRKWKKCCAR